MARKRASLQGRGNEILMGASQEGEAEAMDGSEPQSDIQTGDARASSGLEQGHEFDTADPAVEPLDPDDDAPELSSEWEGLLQEEASSASSGESSALSGDITVGIDPSLPPLATTPARPNGPRDGTPADAAGMLGAVADASLTLDEPTPPAPMYSESYDPVSASGAYVPAPREKPEATDTIMRAKLGGLLYEQATVKPSDADLEPEGPGASEMVIDEIEGYEAGQPSRTRKEPEILQAIGSGQQSALWDKTLELYEDVPEILSGYADQGRALRLLQEAQDLLLERPRQFDIARYKVGQVQSLVSWRRNVNRWSNTYGWGVFVYEMAWIVALVLGVFAAEVVANLVTRIAGGALGIDGLSRLWSTMMWGGLGGVIGAFYSLYWHVAKVRDFDKQYLMWYVVQPPIGLLLGALVFLLIGSGFVTGQGLNQENQTVAAPLFPYAVACIAGFRQRFILEMIDRVIQVITPSSQPQQGPVPAEEANAEEPSEASE